jgi:hypothetical protein
MRFTPTSLVVGIVSFYKYLLTLLTTTYLFVFPFLKPNPYFMGSRSVDLLMRFLLLFYFAFSYWSVSASLTNQINKTKSYFRGWYRNIISLPLFGLSAIIFGLFYYFLTRWALLTFVQLHVATITFISFVNGLLYAILVFSHYFWLPEEE